MTTLSTVAGASLLAHGLHYAMVLAGLWGLGALLLPHALDRYAGSATGAERLDEHDLRVAALRATVAAGALTSHPAGHPAITRTTPAPGAETAPVDPPRTTSALGLPLALVGSAAAAGIHAAVAPPHLRESVFFGVFFLLVALAQVGWTAALLQRPSVGLLHLAVAGNAALIGLWLVTRTLGLPFGLMPTPHAVGAWDVACVAWQSAVVAACLHTLRDGVPARFPGWFSWHASSRAAVGLAATSLVLLTLCGAHS